MKITKPLTRVIAVGLGISPLFASTNISAAAQNTWLKQNTKEIKSLTSEDYSDLAFLKPLLKDKTVVSLGENFHRVAEYSDVKTRLIKYLHEELDFDVIAFESGLGDSAVIYDNADSLTAQQMMGVPFFQYGILKKRLSCLIILSSSVKRTSLCTWQDTICSLRRVI